MTCGAVGRTNVEWVVGVVLGAEGIVAAELAALKGLVQITDDPLAGSNKAAQGAFRSVSSDIRNWSSGDTKSGPPCGA